MFIRYWREVQKKFLNKFVRHLKDVQKISYEVH
jgi:hypothetical protein